MTVDKLPSVGCVLALATIATGPASPAAAQTGDTSTRAAGLEQITVTARRVEENLQDIPISVTALTGDALERRQIFRSDTLDQAVPNLQFANNAPLAGNNSSSQIFIRGIGQTDPTSTVDPGVGIYIDDVYMGQSLGGTMDFRDIAGVQVLRGPQGTLFGRNTIGGAIVLTTTDPGDEFGGTIRAMAGSDDLLDGFVAFDMPLGETVRTRLTYGRRKQDGYVTRVQTGEDLGDASTYTVTGKLVWQPTDRLTTRVQFDYTESDEHGSPLVFAASDETQTFQRVASADAGCPGFNGDWTSLPAVPLIPDDRCANDFQNKGPYNNNGTFPLESKLENWGAALNISFDLSASLTLKSITSFRELYWEGIRDADNTPLTILHTDYDSNGNQLSQELQLLFQSDTWTGVAGLYYFEEEVDDIVTVYLNTPAPGEQKDSDNNKVENDNWAVFTQWTWSVSDALDLTLGGRYTEDTKGATPDQFNYAAPGVKYLPVQLYEDTFSKFTLSASVAYRWSDVALTYLSYSEGFKGGGWNSHFNRPQTPEEIARFHQFGPEEAETWEIGFKLDLAGDTLRLNGAVFTTDYTDLQFTYRVGVAPYLANAGEASIDGFELEATWMPTNDWLIEAGVGYVDSSIDSLRNIEGTAIGVEVGNVLPYTPEWQGNLGVGYTITLGSGFEIEPRVDVSYQDTTFFDANNTVEIAQIDSETIVNAAVSFVGVAGTWRVTLGVNNATDETYPIAGNSSLTTSSGYAEIAYARPREYYGRLSIDF